MALTAAKSFWNTENLATLPSSNSLSSAFLSPVMLPLYNSAASQQPVQCLATKCSEVLAVSDEISILGFGLKNEVIPCLGFAQWLRETCLRIRGPAVRSQPPENP